MTPRTPLDAALDLLRRGIWPLPVPHKRKGPVIDGWPDLRITANEAPGFFNGAPMNVGGLLGEPSRDIVDVDLDVPEALRLVAAYLPRTGSTFGRASSPGSHRLYRAAGARTEEFKDPADGKMLVELRSTGVQTVMPGSTHESGEAVEWERDGEPAEGDAAKLRGAVARLAAASLLLRARPATPRHDYLMALAGALVRGMGEKAALAFLAPLAAALLDDPKRNGEIRRIVEDTAKKLADDDRVSGWPKLTAAIGKERAGKAAEWLGIRGGAEAGGGVGIRLEPGRWNAMLRKCAGLLGDVLYLRETVPVMLTRAAEAGGEPVADRDGPAVEIRGVRHRPGSLLLAAATPGMVAWQLDERATFLSYVRVEKTWSPTHCPTKDVAARLIEAATELPFRPCAGISRVPLLLGGRLVTTPGHDPATGLILDLDGKPPAIPATLDKDVAAGAARRLLRPFRGYLGSGTVSRPALLAAVLGAVLRPSLPGVPAILIDGNSPAVGKGKLARAVAALVHNGVPAIVTEGHSAEELEKRLAAAVLQGVPVLLLDNLQRTLESSTLESMLTEPKATIRLFGTLNQATVPCRALLIITANNASVRRDLLRRTLQVRIVVPEEKPELRRFDFDPVEEVLRDRAGLLSAAFTLALAWLKVRDLPENAGHRKSLGSFERWADLVAGAVSWLTGENPIDLIEERQEQDRGMAGDRAVFEALAAWQATLPHDENGRERLWWKSAEAAAAPAVTEAWRGVLTFKAEVPGAKTVGVWLAKHKDAVSGALMLRGMTDRTRLGWWSVQNVQNDAESFPTRRVENFQEDYGKEGEESFCSMEGANIRQHSAHSAPPAPEPDPDPPCPPSGDRPRKPSPSAAEPTPPRCADTIDWLEDLGVGGRLEDPGGLSLITDPDQARAAVADLAGRGVVVGLDLETTGLDPLTAEARLLQLAAPGEPAVVIDLRKVGGLASLAGALSGLRAVAHNAVFDTGFLRRAGSDLVPECTFLANHVLTGKVEKLADLAERHLGLHLDKGEQVSDWSGELSEAQIRYAALDAVAVGALLPVLRDRLAAAGGTKAYELMRGAQPAVVAMRLAGMPFDVAAQAVLVERLTAERDRLAATLGEALAGRNVNSGEQLSDWLAWALGGKGGEAWAAWPKTGTGKALATGAAALRRGAALLPDDKAAVVRDLLLPYKVVEKRLTAFGGNLAAHVHPVTGRIHADFRIAATVAGRMSCSRPNLQQVPRDREFRALFKAPAGRAFAIADYSQVELRVAAMLAGEAGLLAAFREGRDTHALTAGMLLGKPAADVTKAERQLAKAVNFGLLYGQGARGLQAYASNSYGVEITEAEAGRHRAAWFAAYPGFRRWHDRTGREGRKALAVVTPSGRVRRWPSADREDPACWKLTEALNTPVQGGAAEAMLAALGHLGRALDAAGLDAAPVAVVHDEVILEAAGRDAPAAAHLLEESMIAGMLEVFPDATTGGLVEARVGASWADK